MRLFRFLFLLTLLMLIAFASVLIFLTLEKTPAVQKTELIDTERAVRAKDLAKRSLKELIKKDTSAFISISASEEDLNSLMAIMARSISRLEGHVNITQGGLYAAVTFRVPHNRVGDFINLGLEIYPSDSGLYVSQVTVGHVKVPGKIALFILRFILDLVLGNEDGTVAMNSVQSVNFKNNTVTFNLRRIPDIMERKEKLVKRLKFFRDTIPPISDPETVRIYYAKLIKIKNRIQAGQSVSLAYFIGPLFQLAQRRSYDSNPEEENKAALLALAMYIGDSRFEKFIGPVRTDEMKLHQPRYGNVLLGGREDLRLHFVISAGLKILTDSGITYAIGEFKELLDVRRGGSGFSFVDLAADLAGTRFAEVATDRSGGARRIQSVLAGEAFEVMFFPKVYDLPEYLSQTEFERIYGNVENAKYLNLVSIIKDRLSQLPAYGKMKFEKK